MSEPVSSPFVRTEDAFQHLAASPRFVLTGTVAQRLEREVVPLDHLRTLLLNSPYDVSDELLAHVIELARTDRDWCLAVVGLLLPGLRGRVRGWTLAVPFLREDVETEALAGLVEGIARIDLAGGRLASRLVWSAARRAHAFLRTQARVAATQEPSGVRLEAPLRLTSANPDLLLMRAVRACAISVDEARLIGDTRLGQLSLREAARRIDVPYKTAAQRRRRAEARLLRWLRTA